MTSAKADKYRKRLLNEKARLERDQSRLMDHGGETMSERMGDISDFDPNHPGDEGTEMFEREKDGALHENLDGLLAQINDALGKLDNGTYGVCDRCGRPIAEARLEALPYATLCIDCQARAENQ